MFVYSLSSWRAVCRDHAHSRKSMLLAVLDVYGVIHNTEMKQMKQILRYKCAGGSSSEQIHVYLWSE